MKVLFLCGLQASGKSTWAKEFVKKNKNWVRVNRDDLRNMRGEYWVPKQENLMTDWEDGAIMSALNRGLSVIIDATNLNTTFRTTKKEMIRAAFPGIDISTKTFDVSVEECIRRDLIRPNSVGEKVIRKTYERYLKVPVEHITQDETLPGCIIVDVDGTLARMHNRSPYDWKKVGQDLPNRYVMDLVQVKKAAGSYVQIFTGRDGVCLPETEAWLKRFGVPYDEIHIRPEGNQEKDSIIKRRMFDDYVRDQYFVELVIDDRLQVCRMWHEMGLPLLRVGDPDASF
jgi:predicted kinase